MATTRTKHKVSIKSRSAIKRTRSKPKPLDTVAGARRPMSIGGYRISGKPTRNFSAEAVKAAVKFRALKPARLRVGVKKERADAIKRAVAEYYGLK